MNIPTTQILCPGCRTNPVSAPSWEFQQTSVNVEVCADCQQTGLTSIEMNLSALAALYVPESTFRHRQGLIELGHKGRSWSGR